MGFISSLKERIKQLPFFRKEIVVESNTYQPSQENKAALVKLLLEFDLLMHLVIGGLFLFLITLVIAWKFDLIDYFSRNSDLAAVKDTKPDVSYTPKLASSDGSFGSTPFINKQEVSIERAFRYRPPKINLTINGQLRKEVFGYLPYWVIPRVNEIDTTLLTSVSYFGLEVLGDGSIAVTGEGGLEESWRVWNSQELENFIKKAKRERIKVYVTLKCFSNENIKKLVSDPDAMDNFISNAIYLMSSKALDGITVDFEYIGQPSKETIDGFSILMASLNKEMKREYPNSVLTIATFATAASTTTLHDVEILANNSDALVIMGYDYATPRSANAGAVAPMDGAGYSLTASLSSYLEKVDPQKLILTVPYYGYDWPVKSSASNSEVVGESSDVRIYPYAEIMDATKGKNINWDENTLTPWYSYTDVKTKQVRVVHFENTRSLGIKYDFINQKNLKGVGIWALGFDGKSLELKQLLADKFAN